MPFRNEQDVVELNEAYRANVSSSPLVDKFFYNFNASLSSTTHEIFAAFARFIMFVVMGCVLNSKSKDLPIYLKEFFRLFEIDSQEDEAKYTEIIFKDLKIKKNLNLHTQPKIFNTRS